MTEPVLSPDDRAIVEEEEALLARARESLERERERTRARGTGELRSLDALRSLRDEALAAKAEDLAPLLHEMTVRQELIRRRADEPPPPDPATPYFAHLRVREEGKAKDYLLGSASHVDPRAGVRIVDWRVAPVAQIFYRYREGEAYEETFPGRTAEGVVEARRIVVVERGRLSQIVGDGRVLARGADGAWSRADGAALALAEGGAGSAVRAGGLGVGVGASGRPGRIDVTALLDARQYAAIAAPPDEPLLVLGSAGSGKTTVALHRFAKIAAQHPTTHPLDRMRVVVPHEGLARLSRRLLAPLGVGAAQVRTLDDWAKRVARAVFGEPFPKLNPDTPALVVSLKRHPALYDALRERFANLPPEKTTLRRLHRRLADALTDRALLERVVAASAGDLPRTAIEETVRHTMLQLATSVERELASITDEDRKHALDERGLDEGTPDELAGTLDLEDLPILLFLRALRGRLGGGRLSHLVLDEAEDLSLFELFVMRRLLEDPPSVTLAGDEAQKTASSFAGWPRSLETLGAGTAQTIRLAVSYRCPRPIAELAREILGPLAPAAPPSASRDGAPVGILALSHEAQAFLFAAGAVRELLDAEPRASIAVLLHDDATARRFHALLGDRPDARLVLEGEFTFDPGVDVTDVDSAKGLEWDYVVVPDATAAAYPQTDEARHKLHVAATRAAHQLLVVSGGRLSPLLAARERTA